MNHLSKKLVEQIDEELTLLESEIEHRLEQQYENAMYNLHGELKKYDWLVLPEYPLMQHQKDEINEAIARILSGQPVR